MATRLLDTNIVSYILNRHTLALAYQPHLTGYDWAVSFQTVAELLEGTTVVTALAALVEAGRTCPNTSARLWELSKAQIVILPVRAARHGCGIVGSGRP